jgi:hypothetical protein
MWYTVNKFALFNSSPMTGTLNRAQIIKMGSLITGAELNSMKIIWDDYLSPPVSGGQTRLVSQPVDRALINYFLDTTMGVEKQVAMNTEGLYLQMGAITKGNFIGLPNMNYTTPVDGWYGYEDIGYSKPVMFQAQIAANNQRKADGPILNPEFKALGLRWHQLCAVHRFMDHVSSPGPLLTLAPGQAHGRQGLLISDEVGIGKTAQALAMISQIIHWASLAENHSSFPEVHGTGSHYNISSAGD